VPDCPRGLPARGLLIAATAAAPVIALANQVALSDSFGLLLLFRRARQDPSPAAHLHAVRGHNYAVVLFLLGYANLLTQVAVLYFALSGLLPNADKSPRPLVLLLAEVAGLTLVLLNSVLSGCVRDEATQLEAAERSLPVATEEAVATIAATLREMLHGPAPGD
jgi:hypothetical protein